MRVVTACLFAANLVAQPHGMLTVPREARLADGNGADQTPFGRDQARHVQYVHRDLLAELPKGVAITALAYRRDANPSVPVMRRVQAGETKPEPFWLLRLSNWRGDVRNPPPEFAPSSDPAWTTVRNPRRIDLPDLALPASGLPGFEVVFPFDRPFVYDGGHLGIEHVIAHRKYVSYEYVVDAVEARGEPGIVETLGFAATGAPRITGAASWPGESFVVQLHGAPPHAPIGWHLFRTSPHSQDPPWIAPIVSVPWICDAEGIASYTAAIPASVLWNGAEFFVEAQLANAASDVARVRLGHLGAPSAGLMSVVAGYPDVEVEHGFVQRGRGLVFQLRW